MSDDFYGAFDRECLQDDLNRQRKKDYRSVFHQDRDRIMFTPSFRRLQSKTQVFQAGEYDFYRTRLTHSLEVANIAKSIGVFLRNCRPTVAIDPDLLDAICLSHDIGHPPFGHAGERVLNALMKNYGGFEGNAQTLRILTRTIYTYSEGERGGMNPSRALLDGVLKYKELYRDSEKKKNHFIYDDQSEILKFCFGIEDLRNVLGDIHPNDFHSLECQVMDCADDIAYSCFDLVDGVKARFLSVEKIEKWATKASLGKSESKYLDDLLDMIRKDKVAASLSLVVGKLIESLSLGVSENFMSGHTHRYRWRIEMSLEAKMRIRMYKELCKDLVFGSSALQQIEAKGGLILRALAETWFKNYLGVAVSESERDKPAEKVLLPSDVHRIVTSTRGQAARARLICDHLAGMTDAYALRSYKRLFDPDYGSISELI